MRWPTSFRALGIEMGNPVVRSVSRRLEADRPFACGETEIVNRDRTVGAIGDADRSLHPPSGHRHFTPSNLTNSGEPSFLDRPILGTFTGTTPGVDPVSWTVNG
jgi:hypothetical protein